MEIIIDNVIRISTVVITNCLCKCYGGVLSIQNPLVSRLWHITLFVGFIALSSFFLRWGNFIASYLPSNFAHLCPHDTCGILLSYRLSFAYTVFHMFLAVILVKANSSEDPRAAFQNAAWGCKFPSLIFVIALCMFIPEWFFLWYGWIMLLFAVVFILFQLVIVIDFSRTVVEITRKIQTVDPDPLTTYQSKVLQIPIHRTDTWKPVIVCSTIVMGSLSLALIWYIIFLFRTWSTCHVNTFTIAVWAFLCVIIAGTSLNKRIQRANGEMVGAFQISVIALYGTFLVWNAVIVHDPIQCVNLESDIGLSEIVQKFTTLLAFIYSIGSIFYASLPESGKTSDYYNYSSVNFFYALCSSYLSMIMTNWSVIRRVPGPSGPHDEIETDLGWIPFVTFFISLVVLAALYVVSLLSPLFFPSRFKHYRKYSPYASNVC